MLKVAPGLQLPADYVTKTAAILAQRRKGKTYTASVLAEELAAAKLPWVALDPTGAWWGLRSSADGLHPGLPVVVVGGQHGDLPLERGAGAFVADLVLDLPGWYVLDLSLLPSREAEREFSLAFARQLHRRKMQPGMDFPLHLFVDEADLFVPQEKEVKGDNLVLGAFSGIVRRGGLHGLGATLISQRPALVNKSVLTQLDLLVLLRLVAGQDLDAVDKNYIARSSAPEERAEVMGSLPSLPVGEAWFYEPGADPRLLRRARVRERRTFNSSATPKPGEKRVEPKVLAAVDLEKLRGRMSAAIERAKQDDPKELRAELARLRRELAARPAGAAEVVERVVEVPALTGEDRRLLAGLGDAPLERWARELDQLRDVVARAAQVAAAPRAVAAPARREKAAPPPRRRPPALAPDLDGDAPALKAGARRIVDVVARHHPLRMSRRQIATLANMKSSGGTFTSYWSTIKRAGLLEEPGDGLVSITEAGLEYAQVDESAPPMTADEILENWRSKLKAGARQILDVLVEEREWLTRDELAARVAMTASGGTFTSYLSTLHRNGLVEKQGSSVRASETLFVAEAA